MNRFRFMRGEMKPARKKRSRHKVKPTWADLQKEVKEAGGEFIRQNSTSHEIWRLPGDVMVILQSKHRNRQVSRAQRDTIRKCISHSRVLLSA